MSKNTDLSIAQGATTAGMTAAGAAVGGFLLPGLGAGAGAAIGAATGGLINSALELFKDTEPVGPGGGMLANQALTGIMGRNVPAGLTPGEISSMTARETNELNTLITQDAVLASNPNVPASVILNSSNETELALNSMLRTQGLVRDKASEAARGARADEKIGKLLNYAKIAASVDAEYQEAEVLYESMRSSMYSNLGSATANVAKTGVTVMAMKDAEVEASRRAEYEQSIINALKNKGGNNG